MKRRVELKNTQREIYHFRLRLVLSMVFVLVMLLTLLTRFIYLQVVRHEHYQTLGRTTASRSCPSCPIAA